MTQALTHLARQTPTGVARACARRVTRRSPFGVEPSHQPGVMNWTLQKETNTMKPICFALALATLATPAAALEPLAQEKYINDRLVAARVADRIRRTCPSIDARLLYAYGEARKLKRYAQQKGYSNAQIDAFLDSKEDKKRIYAVAEDYLTRNGARKGDAESFCRLGRAEIAKKNVIGSLLVAK
ncbi:hypothetical protein SAMN06265221_101100 [Paracoccus laeviglucosivorans]|uniref:DUF5333 domain-containing protein n=2 Tax=Paracoccus laeviglucosivorans TaxID=1197861 RepID=A0A521AFF1_9RHOB|nr:hypothetical protein SAMN06265221_101100 [Paracoccus laeviglucosivorans]